MATLKVFAFDHACAGATSATSATRPSAAQRFDGELMLRALCTDLRRLPGVELVMLDDTTARPAGSAFDQCFTDCVLAADAVWPLAPVGSGVLERLSREVLRHGRILLGSTPTAVRLAGSKRAACNALLGAGIPTVATFGPGDTLPVAPGAWVVKPDDGAGCLDTRLFHDRGAAQLAAAAHAGRELVLQPFVAGRVGSLSLLCRDGMASVLACNEQRMAVHDNHFRFLGVTVNGLAGIAPQLEALGMAVAAALPGLWGYAGVDFILSDSGPLVLDVNPRLTISYAGLHASTGVNPAGAVLALLHPEMPMSSPGRMPACIVDVPAFAPG